MASCIDIFGFALPGFAAFFAGLDAVALDFAALAFAAFDFAFFRASSSPDDTYDSSDESSSGCSSDSSYSSSSSWPRLRLGPAALDFDFGSVFCFFFGCARAAAAAAAASIAAFASCSSRSSSSPSSWRTWKSGSTSSCPVGSQAMMVPVSSTSSMTRSTRCCSSACPSIRQPSHCRYAASGDGTLGSSHLGVALPAICFASLKSFSFHSTLDAPLDPCVRSRPADDAMCTNVAADFSRV